MKRTRKHTLKRARSRYNRPDLANRICALAHIPRRSNKQYLTRSELLRLLAHMQETERLLNNASF